MPNRGRASRARQIRRRDRETERVRRNDRREKMREKLKIAQRAYGAARAMRNSRHITHYLQSEIHELQQQLGLQLQDFDSTVGPSNSETEVCTNIALRTLGFKSNILF